MHIKFLSVFVCVILSSHLFVLTPSQEVAAAVSVQFAVGSDHTCALKQTSVWCWG